MPAKDSYQFAWRSFSRKHFREAIEDVQVNYERSNYRWTAYENTALEAYHIYELIVELIPVAIVDRIYNPIPSTVWTIIISNLRSGILYRRDQVRDLYQLY